MLNRILIDPQAFALKKERLHGTIALRDLDERTWSHDIADLSSELAYTLTGSTDRWQRPVLTLALSGRVPLQCQRCMQPIENFELDEHVQIVLFPTEAQLDEAMLADEELEGMLSADELDVFSLIEDQILMALPFSPRHEQCGNADSAAVNQSKPNPFAVLAGRGMHRSHDALTAPALSVDSATGEVHRPHHISPNGMYRGRKVMKAKGE